MVSGIGKPADVFINVPFDRRYEPLYLAFIAGLVGLGLNPRCVVEVARSAPRLQRLLSLIGSCTYSIHDLSRVQLTRTGQFRVPRFNMPFELGLAVAVALGTNTAHQWRIFEEVPYRLTQSLTDLNGYDQYTHHGRPVKVLEELANLFTHLPEPPIGDPSRLMLVYRELRSFRRITLAGQDVFAARPFGQLVVAARGAVKIVKG